MTDNRTILDLSEDEYERYLKGDPEFDVVTQNSTEDAIEMMGLDPDD